MRTTLKLLASLGLCLSLSAHADKPGEHERYKWKDAEGNLHYDDALTSAAMQAGYDVVNKNGLIVKHVDPPKTAEQIKADREAAAKQAADRRAAEEQAQRDQQILAAYPTEQDLARGQQAQLDSLDQEAHATKMSLDSQEKSLTDMLGRAADLERTGKPVPPVLQKQINTQREIVAKQKAFIAAKATEHEAAAQRFATELVHYREMRARQPAPSKVQQ